MSASRRSSGSWLVVLSVCVSALLALPAGSWAQVPAGNSTPQLLRLEVGDTVWVTEALQLSVEQKTAAGVNRSWDDLVGSIKAGKKLTITLMNSSNVEGKLLAIDGGSIAIEQPGGPRAIAAADVLRVRYAGIRKRHVIYGMLVGAVAGGVTVWAIDHQSSHPSSAAEAVGMGALFVGLPAGAIVGAAMPIGPPLYEAAPVVGKTR